MLRLMIKENSYLAMSVCEFSSPSTVKGDPPVKSSYISTPRLHQSTAWNAWKHLTVTSHWRVCNMIWSNRQWHETRIYLVMSRLSSFHNFWSHIFNGATDRESSFSLFFKNKTKHFVRQIWQNRDKILYPNRRCILIFLCICNEEVRSGYISILMKKYL